MATTRSRSLSGSGFLTLVGISAVLFFLSLLPTELIPEIPVDIDFKPYFLPLTLVALLPVGQPTLAIALGVALGEGLRDLMEGYEVDDPIGFVAYIVGFTIAGYVIGVRPLNRVVLFAGAVACAAVQGAMEASSFLIFGEEGLGVAAMTALGNTLTHGVVMGGIPLLFLVPALHGRFERHLGFAPKGTPEPRRSLEQIAVATAHRERGGAAAPAPGALATVEDLWLRYPGTESPALRGVSLALRAGEILGVLGPAGAGKTTLCLALAGVAPRDTGGEVIGRLRVDGSDPGAAAPSDIAGKVGLVGEDATAQITQVRPLEEVAHALMNRGRAREVAYRTAHRMLELLGLPVDLHGRRSWELSEGEQRLVVLAAALAPGPRLLLLDGVVDGLDAPGRERLRQVLEEGREGRAVLLVENDPELLLDLVDRVLVMQEGAVLREGPTAEVLSDAALLEQIDFALPLRAKVARAVGASAPVLDYDALHPAATHAHRALHQTAPTGVPVLDIRTLSYSYGEDERPALEHVSLSVAAGEILAVLGSHGAGKSTLGRIVAGLLAPSTGEILLDGRRTADMRLSDRLGTVGLALTNPDQSISERTVREEIALPLRRAGETREAALEHAAAVAQRVGLDVAVLDGDPAALSIAERKLVAIAAALARTPRMLVLDEPMTMLDGSGRRRLLTLLRRLMAEGTAVLILDHQSTLAGDIADRVVLLRAGHILAGGSRFDMLGAPGWSQLAEAGVAPPPAARAAGALGSKCLDANELLAAPGRA